MQARTAGAPTSAPGLPLTRADLMSVHVSVSGQTVPTRPTTLACSGYNNKCSTYTAYGMAYGLLAHDMVERFLLHYLGFGSAHAYTRGTVTTPEASHPDRDLGSTDYVAAGVMMAPTYLKWMVRGGESSPRRLFFFLVF